MLYFQSSTEFQYKDAFIHDFSPVLKAQYYGVNEWTIQLKVQESGNQRFSEKNFQDISNIILLMLLNNVM
jgi:hypothetical protein